MGFTDRRAIYSAMAVKYASHDKNLMNFTKNQGAARLVLTKRHFG